MTQILHPEKCAHNPNILRYLDRIPPIEEDGLYKYSSHFDKKIAEDYKSKLTQITSLIEESGAK